jgi:hypothetical protein
LSGVTWTRIVRLQNLLRDSVGSTNPVVQFKAIEARRRPALAVRIARKLGIPHMVTLKT